MHMDESAIRTGFDACLLSDEEMASGITGWRKLPDPFPAWHAAHEEQQDAA